MDDEKDHRTIDEVGRRLTMAGFAIAAAIGLLWFAERRSHEQIELTGDEFNSTPYAIALGIAVAVGFVGLFLQKDDDDSGR